MTHGSGDYVIAFSVHKEVRIRYRSPHAVEAKPIVRDDRLSPLFLAAKEATEEAVINSLLRATSVTGFQGHSADAIPIGRVVEICKKYGVRERSK
jgi:D-aminopeptidase